MAGIKNSSALDSLNEQDYINELYGKSNDTQKQLLQDNYAQNSGVLDQEQHKVQQQTGDSLERTYIEAAKSAGVYENSAPKNISGGAGQQAALMQENTRQKNVTTLKSARDQAEAEIERQRKLLADQYAAAIKQAQADNDMAKAQALYDAAKAEEAQLLAYKKQAAAMMASKGDDSIYDSLLEGNTAGRPESTEPSWDAVRKNEDSINAIYDTQRESREQELLADFQKALSDLEAQRQAQQRKTDTGLTEAYVQGLKGARNYGEVQGAYGQGSGTAAQAGQARDSELLQTLTEIRKGQIGTDGAMGMEGAGLEATYRDAVAKHNADNEAKRIAALIQAAEGEEQKLAEIQELVGMQYAKNKDYSLLGLLYGLTPDQIDRLQGTGKYRSSGGGPNVPRKATEEVGTDGKIKIPEIKTSNYKMYDLGKYISGK